VILPSPVRQTLLARYDLRKAEPLKTLRPPRDGQNPLHLQEVGTQWSSSRRHHGAFRYPWPDDTVALLSKRVEERLQAPTIDEMRLIQRLPHHERIMPMISPPNARGGCYVGEHSI